MFRFNRKSTNPSHTIGWEVARSAIFMSRVSTIRGVRGSRAIAFSGQNQSQTNKISSNGIKPAIFDIIMAAAAFAKDVACPLSNR
jgi:hypothetical protein